MPRYKPSDCHALMLPVVLSEQIEPGSFAFALNYLVDHELDLSALDARFRNDEVGASAYDPRVMRKQGPKRLSNKGQELKSNIADPDSANLATNKGVIQGYAAQAAVDSAHQVTRFFPRPVDLSHPSERMRQAIDSPRGLQLYSQRIGTVEPVFANLRHNKRMNRLNLRGQAKVRTQWSLYCMVHNIEKLQRTGFGQTGVQ